MWQYTKIGAAAGVLMLAGSARALVNPSLQPFDLSERNRIVVAATVKSVDDEKHVVHLEVRAVLQGQLAAKEIQFNFAEGGGDDDAADVGGGEDATPANFTEGRLVVAWIGEKSRGGAKSVLMYADQREWHVATLADAAKPHEWTWVKAAEETMVGTFNGQSERLIEMLEHARKGTHFFPAVVYAKFKADEELAAVEGAIGGVGLYDLDRDGRLDVLAAAASGLKVLLQKQAGKFEDATAALGLGGVKGTALAAADVNGDGMPELLVDGVMYVSAGGKYERSALLPAAAAENFKVAAFTDLNGDGAPDVLVSRVGKGLAAYMNPGKDGAAFEEKAEELGLGGALADGNGYITLGDWNLDGRVDIFYASGKGELLVQGQDGKFAAAAGLGAQDFRGGASLTAGLSGAGAFAPVWRSDVMDLVLPADTNMGILTRQGDKPLDVTGFGNEIALATVSQVATLVEDLDMDGYMDLLTVSRDPDGSASYHTNRGYGSFMHAELYTPSFWPGDSYKRGHGGLVAGDVDGDGANDILLGGLDGKLILVASDALSLRGPTQNPVHHLKTLQQTGILPVRVEGKGVVGAQVRVLDASGAIVAIRSIGQTVLTGCVAPDAVNIAIRSPGKYQLVVRYSDGHEVKQAVEIKAGVGSAVVVKR